MRRTFGMAVFLALAASAAWGQAPATYMVSNEPPYRNQGGYGTCWTFAAMASIETSIIKEGLPGYDAGAGLSERDLAWNSGFLDQLGGGLAGINNGGDYLMVAAYLARGGGPLTGAQAPYSGMDTAPPAGQQAPYYVRDIEWYHNVADIKRAVMTYGAVASCWQTSSPQQLSAYSDLLGNTVYYDPGPGVPNPGPGYASQPNHGVAIVGWNDNVQCPPGGGTGAWIIRNSWGDSTQHFGVSYNDFYTGNDTPDTGACNAAGVSFHNVVPNTYQQIYYHNEFGWTGQQQHAYAFNHFTATQTGLLKSASFYTTDDSVGYTVTVFTQFQNGTLGQLATRESGTEAYEGFHTIDLSSLVPLAQGQDFYIELQTSNGWQANDGNVSLQRLLDFQNVSGTGNTTAVPGESYFSDNGFNWTDLQTVDTSANFAIDGLTISMPATMIWNVSSGNWADANCWTSGVPWGEGQAVLSNGGQVIISQGVATCSELILGFNPGDSGSVHMTGGRLDANWITVGQGGAGSFTQSSGMAAIHYGLSIARDANSTGHYILGDGNLIVPRITIGTCGTLTLCGGTLRGDMLDANLLPSVVSSGLIEITSGTYWLASIDCPDSNVLAGTVQIDAGATLWVGEITQEAVVVSGTLILDGSQLSEAAPLNVVDAATDAGAPGAPVPEPATLGLLALGGLGLLGRHRGRGRRRAQTHRRHLRVEQEQ